jgi:hypothetical protein
MNQEMNLSAPYMSILYHTLMSWSEVHPFDHHAPIVATTPVTNAIKRMRPPMAGDLNIKMIPRIERSTLTSFPVFHDLSVNSTLTLLSTATD